MTITSAQCRAARSLLEWTQEELATNARVARATVAEFESNMRRPMKNNVIAIENAMYASGVEFIPEEGTDGVGVRFRERKLQYNRNIKVLTGSHVVFAMDWSDKRIEVVVPREVLEDRAGQLKTEDDYRAATSENLHYILNAVETQMKGGFSGDKLILNSDMFN